MKMKNKTHTNRLWIEILVGVMILVGVIVFSMSSISAYKSFDKVHNTITIKNTFLGVPISNYAQYKLTKNTNQCLIDCSAEGTITLYETGKIFDGIEFQGGNIKSYQFYIKGTDEIIKQIPIFEKNCDGGKNETDCTYKTTYQEEKITVDVWKPYNFEKLSPGNYQWRIEGKKQIDTKVDWIGNIKGEKLSEWAWWNTSWLFKKEINITAYDSPLQNYTVRLNITYEPGMKSDFSDLRFTNSSDNEELSYYIENYTTSVNAYVFVKVPILTLSVTSIHLYFDNPAATTTSNGNNTFELFDTFDNINAAKWTSVSNCNIVSGTISCSNSDIPHTSYYYSTVTFGQNKTAFTRALLSSTATNWASSALGWSSFDGINGWPFDEATDTIGINYYHDAFPGVFSKNIITKNVAGVVQTPVNFNTGTWEDYKLLRRSGNFTVIENYSGIMGGYVGTKLSTASMYFGITAEQNGGPVTKMDWVGISNEAPLIEPSVIYGIPEVYYPNVFLISPQDNYSTLEYKINFLCSGNAGYIKNLTLIINGIDNQTVTNTSLTDNITYNFSVNFPVNSGLAVSQYNWSCRACNIGYCNTTYERNLTIFTLMGGPLGNSTDTFETSMANFNFTLYYNTSIWYLTKADLRYCDITPCRTYQSTKTSGLNYTFYNTTFALPAVNETKEIPYYWEWSISNGVTEIDGFEVLDISSNILTNITVKYFDFNVSDNYTICNDPMLSNDISTIVMNAYDEVSLKRITPFSFQGTFHIWIGDGSQYKNYSANLLSTPNATICFQFDGPSQAWIDAEIQYSDVNSTYYNPRNYYFDNFTSFKYVSAILVDNFVNLYLLNKTIATSFIENVFDKNNLPFVGGLIYSNRWYPGEGIYRTVEISRTDTSGSTVGQFQTETPDYQFNITRDTVLFLSTINQKIVPTAVPYTIQFFLGQNLQTPWGTFLNDTGFTYTGPTLDNSTKIITFSYEDTSGITQYVRMVVSLINSTSEDNVICDVNSTLDLAALTCDTTGYNGSVQVSIFLSRSPESPIITSIIILSQALRDAFGRMGYFLGWLIIITGFMVAIYNPTTGIVTGNVACWVVWGTGMISFGLVWLIGLLALSIWVIVELNT